jgi:hypothetical protein
MASVVHGLQDAGAVEELDRGNRAIFNCKRGRALIGQAEDIEAGYDDRTGVGYESDCRLLLVLGAQRPDGITDPTAKNLPPLLSRVSRVGGGSRSDSANQFGVTLGDLRPGQSRDFAKVVFSNVTEDIYGKSRGR